MSKPIVASYCTTFLKPEMLHIYRQITGLRDFDTFVITQTRQCEERFPLDELEVLKKVRSNFARRFWLKYIRKEPPIVYRGEYGVLNSVLTDRHADMMHVYFGHTAVHLLPFIKRWPKPVVASFHGMDVQPRKDRPGYAQRLKAVLRTLPLVLARSESLKERLIELGCPPEKIRINRTGIPFESFPMCERALPADGAWRIVQACRLIEKKGLEGSLRSFAGFLKKYPLAVFTIAGDGPLEFSLREQAEALGIAERVRFAGFLDEEALCKLYSESHIFLHPSQLAEDQNQEGVPNSMLEAMATGLPVVATLHGGIPEAVTQGSSGFLVKERDVPALESRLHQLAGDEALWRKMGGRASEEVRAKFEQRSQIEQLEGYYREAIEMHGA
jgi:colanic acid/amylovoran biosynthesis glycosyltransferase